VAPLNTATKDFFIRTIDPPGKMLTCPDKAISSPAYLPPAACKQLEDPHAHGIVAIGVSCTVDEENL
jgi:hypothetical protein